MKYIMPTMGKGLRRIIEKRFDVVMIDEYKTSKLCSKCHTELKNWNNHHRILCCNGCSGSESKNSTFINRDINACVNIMNLCKDWITHKRRNEVFQRNFNNDRQKMEKHC
jgi:transposase